MEEKEKGRGNRVLEQGRAYVKKRGLGYRREGGGLCPCVGREGEKEEERRKEKEEEKSDVRLGGGGGKREKKKGKERERIM
jgi:3'-phosphoadenosine 5'-phosphosulfate sulfotransferase (PAPS reductase)/FAD synthetase